MLILSFPETEKLARKVAQKLKCAQATIKPKKFPDGESYIKLPKNPKNKTVVLIDSIVKNPNQKLIDAILVAGAAKDSGAKKVILFATYLPYMRQDVQFNPYESISSKHILKTLSTNFDKIFALDPHLHRISTLKKIAKNAQEITANNEIAEYIKKHFSKDVQIVGPDKESFQWAKRIANQIGVEAVVLKKTRFSSHNVKIQEQKLGQNLIIIDDIISTGRTILETIKIARKQGAKKITVITIHGLLLENSAGKITKRAKLITTNAIENKFAKIEISPNISSALRKYL